MGIRKWKYKCKNGHIFEQPYKEERLFYSLLICPKCRVKEFRKILVDDAKDNKNIVTQKK